MLQAKCGSSSACVGFSFFDTDPTPVMHPPRRTACARRMLLLLLGQATGLRASPHPRSPHTRAGRGGGGEAKLPTPRQAPDAPVRHSVPLLGLARVQAYEPRQDVLQDSRRELHPDARVGPVHTQPVPCGQSTLATSVHSRHQRVFTALPPVCIGAWPAPCESALMNGGHHAGTP